jgi:acetyl/propionyl-CoA carboxylase alpha subunit
VESAVPVPFSAILIANRGEIAIRIANACADLGIQSVGVFAEDDQASLHVRQVDEAVALPGRGVPAYLDGAQLIAVAREQGCEAIHPGYGFLAESAEFAEQCEEAGLTLIGPGTGGEVSGAVGAGHRAGGDAGAGEGLYGVPRWQWRDDQGPERRRWPRYASGY